MDMRSLLAAVPAGLLALGVGACSSDTVGGAAVGAVGAGAAYEYQMNEQLKELDKQRERGEISDAEYERRKKDIEDRSLIQ